MSDTTKKTITAAEALKGESPLVLTARFEPVAGLDRFQPAGFPEIGHVLYKAPRHDGSLEQVCIVDSPASMANHLESVCMRGAHDYELVDELTGMPYVRCVTGLLDDEGTLTSTEVVVTSLTEGHRIASSYFVEGERLQNATPVVTKARRLNEEAKQLKKKAKDLSGDEKKKIEKEVKQKEDEAKRIARERLRCKLVLFANLASSFLAVLRLTPLPKIGGRCSKLFFNMILTPSYMGCSSRSGR